jgi:hypothetical protein
LGFTNQTSSFIPANIAKAYDFAINKGLAGFCRLRSAIRLQLTAAFIFKKP